MNSTHVLIFVLMAISVYTAIQFSRNGMLDYLRATFYTSILAAVLLNRAQTLDAQVRIMEKFDKLEQKIDEEVDKK